MPNFTVYHGCLCCGPLVAQSVVSARTPRVAAALILARLLDCPTCDFVIATTPGAFARRGGGATKIVPISPTHKGARS